MRGMLGSLGLAAIGLLGWPASHAAAQQVTVGTPYHSLSDSFFERTGTHWGFNWGGLNFSFGGPNMALPQFGGFDPSAGITGGWATQRGDFNGFFNFAAGQGYRQSFVSQVPSVTMMNGQTAYISDTSQSPFVMGFIPVVGGYPIYPTISSPLSMTPPIYSFGNPGTGSMPLPEAGNPRVQELLRQRASGQAAAADDLPEPPAQAPPLVQRAVPQAAPPAAPDEPAEAALPRGAAANSGPSEPSSAALAVPSVAEARRLHELENSSQNDEATVLFERGRTAEEAGKIGAAKIFYQMAAKRASGALRDQVQVRLAELNSPGTP